MPAAKRPLSEVDPNASRLHTTSMSKHKILKPGDRYGVTNDIEVDGSNKRQKSHESLNSTERVAGEQRLGDGINYRAKDNSRLKNFLMERDLPSAGTREEMIALLERYPADYESLPSAQLSEMLRDRHVVCSSQGSKEVKIQRLRVNDMIDRETGNSEEGVMYGRLAAYEDSYLDLERELSSKVAEYAKLTTTELSSILKARDLPSSGSVAVKVARLKRVDETKLQKAKERMESLKNTLETKIGHPVDTVAAFKLEGQLSHRDAKIQREAVPSRPTVPTCQYDWKGSHWAKRTEREIREICRRREMPGGYGTKAAMLKWLDTGSLDYEDLFLDSLASICRERELHFKSTAKKVDLIKLLQENDNREEVEEDVKSEE